MNTINDHIKVSVIITTFNRYSSLIKAIGSVQNQSYQNIEIIVVNDKSTQKEYYEKKHPENIKWINLERSSRDLYGYPTCGYARNIGIQLATGQFICFLDDDDFWLPNKIKIQLALMLKNNWSMSCTEGYIGDGAYKLNFNYKLYYGEYYLKFSKDFFNQNNVQWNGSLPEVFNLSLIQKHNFIILCSVMIRKELLEKSGLFKEDIRLHDNLLTEDKELWLRLLKFTDCPFINIPLIYYDGRISTKILPKAIRKIKKIFKLN